MGHHTRYRGTAVKEQALITRLEAIGASDYVEGIRAHGREHLDTGLRTEMAELYEDLRPLLRQDRLSPRSRAVLRLVEPVLQSEWKLLTAPDPEPDAGRPWSLPLERRGKTYVSYANLRVLNQVLGINRHVSDAAVESAVWRVVAYLASSWAGYEERSLAGTETWNQAGCPPDAVLVERCDRLRALTRAAGGPGPARRARTGRPPAEWSQYLRDPAGVLRLEFLTALPQTRLHEEVVFLRTIHLTEACMWGILARVMTAIEWIKQQRWAPARECLIRATALAQVQTEVFEIMKTMTAESFLAFRANTGESSAVQSTANHLLHIFMQGVDPAKAEAMADVPENEYLLRYANPHFMPLRHAVETVPADDPDGQAVVEQARRIDRELFRWRASHYGVARRYVPQDGMGTGGTAGAAYLKKFYAHRIFTTTGGPARPPEVVSPLDQTPPIDRGRARPILSWQN